jgi:hypothetical protein
MTRTIRVIGIAALALALGALAGPGLAGAKLKKKKFHGQVTIVHEKNASSGEDRFFGIVSSPKARCANGARVDLGFRPAFEGGGGTEFPRTIVASTNADPQGNWQIFYKVTPNPAYDFQSYSASSPKRILKTKKKNLVLVCKFATSEVITLFPG